MERVINITTHYGESETLSGIIITTKSEQQLFGHSHQSDSLCPTKVESSEEN